MEQPHPELPPRPSYCDAVFHRTQTGFRIAFRLEDPHGARGCAAILGIVVTLLGLGLLMWASNAMLISEAYYGRWPALVVGIVLLGVAIACLMLFMIGLAMRSDIVFDGSDLFIGMAGGNFTGYRFPRGDVKGLRIHRAGDKSLDLHLNAPRGERWAKRVPCHLEVVTPDGVVRVLSHWAEQDIRWAAQVVNIILDLEPLADRDDANTDPTPQTMETGFTLPTRYRWMIGLPCALVIGFVGYWTLHDGLQLTWETCGQICVMLLFLLPLVWALHGGGGEGSRKLMNKYYVEAEKPSRF